MATTISELSIVIISVSAVILLVSSYRALKFMNMFNKGSMELIIAVSIRALTLNEKFEALTERVKILTNCNNNQVSTIESLVAENKALKDMLAQEKGRLFGLEAALRKCQEPTQV